MTEYIVNDGQPGFKIPSAVDMTDCHLARLVNTIATHLDDTDNDGKENSRPLWSFRIGDTRRTAWTSDIREILHEAAVRLRGHR